jgi:hypothetical protein
MSQPCRKVRAGAQTQGRRGAREEESEAKRRGVSEVGRTMRRRRKRGECHALKGGGRGRS